MRDCLAVLTAVASAMALLAPSRASTTILPLGVQPLPSGLIPPDQALLLSAALYIAVLTATCFMVCPTSHCSMTFRKVPVLIEDCANQNRAAPR